MSVHYFTRLQETMSKYWDRKALCNYHGEEITFSQLAEHIERFHIFFQAAGFNKGDKIALCAKNSARWATSFLAINTYETVVVPILSDFLPENMNHLVDHSESVALFTDPELWEQLDINKMPKVKAVISTLDFSLLYAADESVAEAFNGVDAVFAEKYNGNFSAENVNYPTLNGPDLAVINYTSGTTSAPKGVMLRYEGFTEMVQFGIDNIYVDGNDKIVSMLPMGHIYGLAFEFLYPLCFGCTVYYLGKSPSPSLLLKAMAEVQPYMVVTVPLVMEKVYKNSIKPVVSKPAMKVLLAIPGIRNILFGVIGKKLQTAFGGKARTFIMGGAALNPEVEKWFKRIKLPYTVGYGMTEASPLLAYSDWRSYAPGSCGRPVTCAEVRIDSPDPQKVPGEIQARGTNICSGYFNNPEASANAFTEDGWLRTGDLGIMDAKGNIFIKGRSKNMILSANGQNIYPEEVEAVINARDYVTESVVVDRGSKLVALVYIDPAQLKNLAKEAVDAIPEQIRTASNALLPAYSQITKVELVADPFEKTPKMSIKRFMYK